MKKMMNEIEYREFETGKEVIEYYCINYIFQVVPIAKGFGVFAKKAAESDIRRRVWGSMPAYSYFSDEQSAKDFPIWKIDMSKKFYPCEFEMAARQYIETIKSYCNSNGEQFYDVIEVNGPIIIAKNSRLVNETQNDI